MLAHISAFVLLSLVISSHGSNIKNEDNEKILEVMNPLLEIMEEIEKGIKELRGIELDEEGLSSVKGTVEIAKDKKQLSNEKVSFVDEETNSDQSLVSSLEATRFLGNLGSNLMESLQFLKEEIEILLKEISWGPTTARRPPIIIKIGRITIIISRRR